MSLNCGALYIGGASLLLSCVPSIAQTSTFNSVQLASICELLRDPAQYDAKTIRFRGRIELEFEDNHVDDRACGLPFRHKRISWDLGSEEVWGNSAGAIRARALTSPILRDAQFDEFHSKIQAHRARRPDGEPCTSYRECAHYDVVATFTGKFFVASPLTRQMLSSEYARHRFVIERIEDVVASPNSIPPDSLSFSCDKEAWQLSYLRPATQNLETHLAENQRLLADQMRAHADDALIEPMQRELSPFADLTGVLRWSSPDLLTTYTIRFPPPPKRKQKTLETAGGFIAPAPRRKRHNTRSAGFVILL